MSELLHRIKVFVYSMYDADPHYLLLRNPGFEGFWVPIQGNLQFGEKLESAIRREVMSDTGIGRPMDLIDLEMPYRWLLGDEEIIEWNFGFRTMAKTEGLELTDRYADFSWVDFSTAYPKLELEPDRAAIMRLHTMLNAA